MTIFGKGVRIPVTGRGTVLTRNVHTFLDDLFYGLASLLTWILISHVKYKIIQYFIKYPPKVTTDTSNAARNDQSKVGLSFIFAGPYSQIAQARWPTGYCQ